jgi:hypothetical protein
MDNDRDILLVAIFTCITVSAWIFFELVKTAKTSTLSTNTTQLVKSMQTTIDEKTLTTLSERMIYR